MSAQNVKNVRIKKALICKVEAFRFKIFSFGKRSEFSSPAVNVSKFFCRPR